MKKKKNYKDRGNEFGHDAFSCKESYTKKRDVERGGQKKQDRIKTAGQWLRVSGCSKTLHIHMYLYIQISCVYMYVHTHI